MWIDATIKDFDAIKAAELEKVNQLERTYWDAWERSVTEQIKTRVQSGEKGTTQSVEKADYFGDPRFLKGIESCVDLRCKILGVYKAAEKEQGVGSMGPITLRVMYGSNGLEGEED